MALVCRQVVRTHERSFNPSAHPVFRIELRVLSRLQTPLQHISTACIDVLDLQRIFLVHKMIMQLLSGFKRVNISLIRQIRSACLNHWSNNS